MSWGWGTFFAFWSNYLLSLHCGPWLQTVLHNCQQTVHCVCRMSLNSLKPQSTLGRTCPGTWLRCTRSVPRTQTSSGRWATRGEHSRSVTGDITAVPHAGRLYAVPFQEIYLIPCFLSAACVEKAAGHHRAPPAEAGSVCHVQQQQVVLHSSSSSSSTHLPILPSSLLRRSAAQRRPSMLCPHHHGNPTTTLHHVLLR